MFSEIMQPHLIFPIDNLGTVHLKGKKRKMQFNDFNPKVRVAQRDDQLNQCDAAGFLLS
jgi:hypothetical protein